MAGGRTFKFIFDADVSGVETGTGRVVGSLDKIESKAESTGGKLSKAAADVGKIATGIVLADGVQKLPGLIMGVTGAASDMNESIGKATVVFGDNEKGIEEWASHSAKNLGETKQHTIESVATFGNLFKTIGLGADPTRDMSKGIVTLGSDLASFNNIPVGDALEKLRSGLAGESEPLRSMGIFLTEAGVKAKAMQMGLADAKGELSESAKVQARYALIMEQSATAQGDFARTSSGQANQQKILNAEWEDAQEKLGEKLLPAQLALTQAMVAGIPIAVEYGEAAGEKLADGAQLAVDNIDKLEPAMNAAGEAGQLVYDIFGPLITDIFGELVDVAKEVGPVFRDDMVPALQEVEPVLKPLGILAGVVAAGPIYLLLQAVKFLTPWVGEYLVLAMKILSVEITAGMKVYGAMVTSVQFVIDKLKDAGGAVTTFVGFVKDIPSKLGDVPGLLKQKGIDMVTGFFGGAKELWDDGTKGVAVVVGFVAAIPDKVGDVTKLLYDKGQDVLSGLFEGQKFIWESEAKGFKAIVGFVLSIPDKVGDVAKLLWDKGEDVMGGLTDGANSLWDSEVRGFKVITGAVLGIPEKVGDVGKLLWDKGSDIGTGFIDGIVDGASKVAGGMADITSAVKHGLHDALQAAFDWAHNNLSIGLPSFDTPFGSFGGGSLGFPYVDVPGFAAGVRDFAGGLALVGEQGPELVALPRGADVFSNAESRAMVQPVRGATTVMNFNIYGNWTAADDAAGRITQGNLDYFISRRLDRYLRAIGSSA